MRRVLLCLAVVGMALGISGNDGCPPGPSLSESRAVLGELRVCRDVVRAVDMSIPKVPFQNPNPGCIKPGSFFHTVARWAFQLQTCLSLGTGPSVYNFESLATALRTCRKSAKSLPGPLPESFTAESSLIRLCVDSHQLSRLACHFSEMKRALIKCELYFIDKTGKMSMHG